MISLLPEYTNLLPADGEAYYIPNFVSPLEAKDYFGQLQRSLPWEQYPITLFGRTVLQPRLISFHGDPGVRYRYSRHTFDARDWSPLLWKIKEELNRFCREEFNGVLANLYRDGSDSMGWHSDDEEELGLHPLIASVSLGQGRAFEFKHKSSKFGKIRILLEGGSLLIMAGACQEHWLHSLPKGKNLGPRINLTYRRIYC